MTRDQLLEKVREARAAGERADLTDVDLTGADLTDTDLTDTDLTYAELRGVNLTDARLGGAHLTRVDLTDAILTGADLTNSVLTYACLRGAHPTPQQLLDTRGLRPEGPELQRDTWDAILPANPEQRQLVEHLLNDGWGGTLREAIATVEGLAGR